MPLPDEALELLRTRSGLSIDDEGRFLHRGEPITHARTLAVLWGSLSQVEDGRWLVRIGRESGYVTVAETPWIVRAVRGAAEGGCPILVVSDGSEEPLDPATLRVGADGVLRCTLSRARPARFSRGAHVALGSALEEIPSGSGRFVLEVCGERWPVVRVD